MIEIEVGGHLDHGRALCMIGDKGKIVLVCPADCTCTIERQRAIRDIAKTVQCYLAKREGEDR